MKVSLVAFLVVAAVPVLAEQSVSPEQAYIDCVGRQTVRFSPNGKPFDAVLETANLACTGEAASMQAATPALVNITKEFARRTAFLYFMKSRAHLPTDHPGGR